MTRHELVNPPSMAPAIGFSHVVRAAGDTIVQLAGQCATSPSGEIVGDTFVEQFDLALENVRTALAAVGAVPSDVISLLIFTTDMAGYRSNLSNVGSVYRSHFASYFPAMAMFGVTELVEPAAKLEIVATAVVSG